MATIDLYDPRGMAQALRQMKKPRTFLRELMCKRDEEYVSEYVDVDIQTGARRMPAFVSPNSGPGKTMDRIGFSTQTYTAPMVAPKRQMTVTDLQKRLIGENIYSTQTPEERAAILLGQDLAELDESITRVEEWMCAQAAFTSAIPIVGPDVNQTITFPRNAALVPAAPGTGHGLGSTNGAGNPDENNSSLTLAGPMSTWDRADASIPAQIRAVRRLISRIIGLNCDYAVLGQAAADALLSAPSLVGLTGLLNTQRMDLGMIKPELREGGATYLGQFAGTGVDLWAYDEFYIDPVDGIEKPIVPPKNVLFGCSKGYTVMRYGAVGVTSGLDQSSQITLIGGKRIPESWIVKEPAVRVIKVSSRPLPVPVQNDGYCVLQVLV